MKVPKIFHPHIMITLTLLLLLSIPFVFSDLDLHIQSHFFHNGWIYAQSQPWLALYKFGTIPGLLLGIVALVLYLGSWIWPRLFSNRRAAALIILTLIIGPGILVNALGKGYWGRPRPREVTQFNGQDTFHRLHQPGTPGRGKSFPCGHASVGFVIMVMFFVHRKYRWFWLGSGLTYGSLMGLARMVQGAHFASDVLWSGGLTFLTAAVLNQLMSVKTNRVLVPPTKFQKWLSSITLTCSILALVLLFMTATPYYKKWTKKIDLPDQINHVVVALPQTKETVHIIHQPQKEDILVKVELQGFGFPKLHLSGNVATATLTTTATITPSYLLKGYVTERTGKVTISLRDHLWVTVKSDNPTQPIVIGDRKLAGYLGSIEINQSKYAIQLNLGPESIIESPLILASRTGSIKVDLNNLASTENHIWKIGSDSGNVDIHLTQSTNPNHIIKLMAWSHHGCLTTNAHIGTRCGLNMLWQAKQKQAQIKTNGTWQTINNRIYSPEPAFIEMVTSTNTGQLRLNLSQIEPSPDDQGRAKEQPPVPDWIKKILNE